MAEPLAYFLTWSTYGTWLPGDERGWVEFGCGWQLPDPARKLEAAALMTEDACRLDAEQRRIVEQQIAETRRIRGWVLHTVNCRSNHVHVVVTARLAPRIVRSQLKAWCTRRLKELKVERSKANGAGQDPIRENWWSERGSGRIIDTLESLEAAVIYVRDGQDHPRRRV